MDRVAGIEAVLVLRGRRLDDDFATPGEFDANAQVIALIEDLLDVTAEAIGATERLDIELDALGPHREHGALTNLGDVSDAGLDARPVAQTDLAGVAIDRLDRSVERVVFTDEVGDEIVGGFFVERRRRVDLLDHALVENSDAVGHRQRLTLVVRHEYHSDAEFLVEMLDFELHLFAQLLVERAERLVHQHQFGVENQRAGQRDALLLPARELLRIAVAVGTELNHAERARHLGVDFGVRQLAHRQRETQVVDDGHVRKQRVVLEHHADVALVRRHPVDDFTGQPDLAAGRRLEARQHHQAGRLARTRRAEQRQELAATNIEVQVTNDQIDAVVGLLNLAEGHVRRLALGSGFTALCLIHYRLLAARQETTSLGFPVSEMLTPC